MQPVLEALLMVIGLLIAVVVLGLAVLTFMQLWQEMNDSRAEKKKERNNAAVQR